MGRIVGVWNEKGQTAGGADERLDNCLCISIQPLQHFRRHTQVKYPQYLTYPAEIVNQNGASLEPGQVPGCLRMGQALAGFIQRRGPIITHHYFRHRQVLGQKEKIQRNTEQFVHGQPANNVLLTGARGTGKSSLIKACLNTYASAGLRLIEVDKADLTDLPDIIEVVADRPEKFIVFCDDLSFEDGEPGYKALKSILDGTVAAATPNVLIYATSNRSHLLPEYMRENLTYTHTDDGEVHPGEGVEEKISLSERFGLWVSFYPFSQDEYLAIAAQWLASFGVATTAIEAARPEALVWALERGSRSGRVAWQFARDWAGARALEARERS